jgi:plastocyanin
MALGLIMLATAACGDRPPARQETVGTPQASGTPEAKASLAASVAANHKISVKLKKDKTGTCVVEDPGRTRVGPGDKVRWKYRNQCGMKKKERVDRKNAPISGNCEYETEIEDGDEKEGDDCTVDANATVGVYPYGIAGDAALDPELEIPPPPPPAEKKAEPPPSAK